MMDEEKIEETESTKEKKKRKLLKKREKRAGNIMVVAFVTILAISTLNAAVLIPENSSRSQIVLVDTFGSGEVYLLNGMEIIDSYGDYVLIDADEDEIQTLTESDLSLDLLHDRTMISIKGHEFDIFEKDLDICDELSISSYPEGSKGIYIVHMLGPINPDWVNSLQSLDVQIINYVPNYAYEVRMTPEQVEEVKDLYFVDWVGIYQPAFKLQNGLKPGRVDIRMVPGSDHRTIETISSKISVDRSVSLGERGYRVIADVEDTEEINWIARMNDVYYISQYSEPQLASEIESQIIGGGIWIMDDQDGDPTTAYRVHGDFGAYINQLGYTGKDVIVNVADTGLGDGTIGDAGHPDFTGRVIGGYSYSEDGVWRDGGLGHGTHCTGSLAGDTYHGTGVQFAGSDGEFYVAQGLAYDSELFVLKIFTGGGAWIGPDEIYPILQIPKQQGDAYVQSNSWGDRGNPGHYIFDDEVFDAGVRDADEDSPGNDPMVVVAASGNEGRDGYQTTISPGTAKNTITIGGTETHSPDGRDYGQDRVSTNPNNVGDFSSRGWTADNRIKPDVVAPGQGILSTKCPESIPSSYMYSEDGRYEFMSGTSMATPAAAGAAAVVVEWYEVNYGEKPNPAMVKALMINTAEPLDSGQGNTGHIPNRDEGWGMVDISKLEYPLHAPVPFYLRDEVSLLSTGETDEYEIEVDRMDEPLKISLAWTDKNAMVGDDPTLKNDLNLEVESPSGNLYRGNAFSGGWTQANTDTMSDFDRNGDGWDDTNNVQNVFIHPDDLETGTHTVRITGHNVPSDANNDGYANQDYALVGYNALIIGDAPSIDVLSPQGDELWNSGEERDILWETEEGDDPIGWIDLAYSVDGGLLWNVIDTRLADTGSYTWEVPNENSEECLIRISAHDEVGRIGEGVSQGSFTITGTPPSPPQGLDVEHFDLKQTVDNSDFSEDYEPWNLFRDQDDGEARWDADSYISGGSIHVRAVQHGSGTTAEESYWEQELDPISSDIRVSAAYRRNIVLEDDIFDNVDHATVEILVHDTETGWQTLLMNDATNEGDTGWMPFGEVVYRPEGEVDIVRARMHVEARGGYLGDTAIGELWMDNITVWAEINEGGAHNHVSWDASPDDPEEVGHYNIYRMETQSGPWIDPIDSVIATGSSNYSYVDEDKGSADDIHWWYVVRAVGINGMEEDNTDAKQEPGADTTTFDVELDGEGWNFVSFNLIPVDSSLNTILDDPENGISGSYDKVMYYDASVGRWFSHVVDRSERFNNLDTWDHSMGVWIRMLEDDTLTVEGSAPVTTTIELHPGWNMIGLAVGIPGDHGLPEEVDKVGYYDALQDYNIAYESDTEGFVFHPGNGYYVLNPTDEILQWVVEY